MFTSTSCVSHRSWRVTFFARLICLSVRKNRNILILCHILGFPRKYSEGFLSAHFQPSSRQVIGFHVVFLARMYSACYRNFFLVIFPDHYRGKNGNRGGHLSVFLLGVKQARHYKGEFTMIFPTYRGKHENGGVFFIEILP